MYILTIMEIAQLCLQMLKFWEDAFFNKRETCLFHTFMELTNSKTNYLIANNLLFKTWPMVAKIFICSLIKHKKFALKWENLFLLLKNALQQRCSFFLFKVWHTELKYLLKILLSPIFKTFNSKIICVGLNFDFIEIKLFDFFVTRSKSQNFLVSNKKIKCKCSLSACTMCSCMQCMQYHFVLFWIVLNT